jgi:ADP-heptose:LPS heptosyltransferase
LPLLEILRLRLTLLNAFPGIGDVLFLSSLVESIKIKYPNIKINVVTEHCDLLKNNDSIYSINQKTTFFTFRHLYLEIRQNKTPDKHVLTESLNKLGLPFEIQKPKYVVTSEERKNAKIHLKDLKRPFIAINTSSKEPSKNWLPNYWKVLIERLSRDFTIIQLGNESEIEFENSVRLAGKLDLRESISVLEKCSLFIGGVSFLMHAAATVGVKSVIIYGGRETPSNSGYSQNINLFERMECGPCWIHEEDGEFCKNEMSCMKNINISSVYSAIKSQLR